MRENAGARLRQEYFKDLDIGARLCAKKRGSANSASKHGQNGRKLRPIRVGKNCKIRHNKRPQISRGNARKGIAPWIGKMAYFPVNAITIIINV